MIIKHLFSLFLIQFVTIIRQLFIVSLYFQYFPKCHVLTHLCNNKCNAWDISNRKYRQSSRNSSTIPHTCQRIVIRAYRNVSMIFVFSGLVFRIDFDFTASFTEIILCHESGGCGVLLRIFGNSVDNSLVDKKENKERFNLLLLRLDEK